jgi:hypothetical protein
LIKNVIQGVVIFAITASNIYWQWANDYVACVLALVAAAIFGHGVAAFRRKRSEERLRKLYGKDWS